MDEKAQELLGRLRELQGVGADEDPFSLSSPWYSRDSTTCRLVEFGRLWAESGDYTGGLSPDLPEEVIARVRPYEEPPTSMPFSIEVVAMEAVFRVRVGASRRLVELYLEETGVHPETAAAVQELERDTVLFAYPRMPEGEQEQALELQRRVNALRELRQTLEAKSASWSMAGELRELSAPFARGPGSEGGEPRREVKELLEAAWDIEEVYGALLTNKAGERQPRLTQWLADRGWGGLLGWASRALQEYENERLKRELEKERGLRLEAELKAKAEKKLAGYKLLLPQAIRSAAGPAGRLAEEQLKRIEQGELLPFGENTRSLLEGLPVEVSRRQLAELGALEWRVLIGSLSIFSAQGDDGFQWTGDRSLEWRLFCQACAVDPSNGQMVRRLLKAAHDLGGRTFRVVVQGKDKEGRGSILAGTEQILRAVVEHDGEDPKAQAAVRRWLRNGEWKGPAPRRITLRLSSLARMLPGALALDGSTLERLESGAQEARDRMQGMDFTLLFELFRLGVRQTGHLGPNGRPLSFVDRESFLLECHGEEKVERERRSGRYASRIEKPYLTSVDVLVAAGFIYPDWTAGHKGRNGVRDVFEVKPGILFGEGEEVPAVEDPTQETLLLEG